MNKCNKSIPIRSLTQTISTPIPYSSFFEFFLIQRHWGNISGVVMPLSNFPLNVAMEYVDCCQVIEGVAAITGSEALAWNECFQEMDMFLQWLAVWWRWIRGGRVAKHMKVIWLRTDPTEGMWQALLWSWMFVVLIIVWLVKLVTVFGFFHCGVIFHDKFVCVLLWCILHWCVYMNAGVAVIDVDVDQFMCAYLVSMNQASTAPSLTSTSTMLTTTSTILIALTIMMFLLLCCVVCKYR